MYIIIINTVRYHTWSLILHLRKWEGRLRRLTAQSESSTLKEVGSEIKEAYCSIRKLAMSENVVKPRLPPTADHRRKTSSAMTQQLPGVCG